MFKQQSSFASQGIWKGLTSQTASQVYEVVALTSLHWQSSLTLKGYFINGKRRYCVLLLQTGICLPTRCWFEGDTNAKLDFTLQLSFGADIKCGIYFIFVFFTPMLPGCVLQWLYYLTKANTNGTTGCDHIID